MTVRLRPEARDDLRAAMAWYEEREAGLGGAFLTEAGAAFEQIAARPDSYARVHGDICRALMRRFPYAIYFLFEEGHVLMLAILHQRQDRGVIMRRDV
jgi:plasmid stabilization system protein ParE